MSKKESVTGNAAGGIWVAETLIWVGCYSVQFWTVGIAVSLAHLVVSGMLYAGMIKNRKLQKQV